MLSKGIWFEYYESRGWVHSSLDDRPVTQLPCSYAYSFHDASGGLVFTTAFALLKNGATQDYIGEPISQLEHALQCAHLAEKQTGDMSLIMAALFHDIGHLLERQNAQDQMQGLGHRFHEKVGARYLYDLGFSEKVAELVGSHVDAKRFLVATNKTYAARLSEASQQTLAIQGGPMSEAEVFEFSSDPLFKEKLQLRVWDEKAKEVNFTTPTLDHYESLYRESLDTGLKNSPL